MFKRLAFIPLAGLLLALAYALTVSQVNAANETVVKVTMQEWKMDIAPVTIAVGSPVRFEFANKGVIAHEVVLEKAGEMDKALKTTVNGQAVVADTAEIAPGTSKTLTWTFTEPGTYWAACHIKGHFEAGMKVAFTVVPATANVPTTTTSTPTTTTNTPTTTTNTPTTTTDAPATTTNSPATTTDASAPGDTADAASTKTSRHNSRLYELDQRFYPPDNMATIFAERGKQQLRLDLLAYP